MLLPRCYRVVSIADSGGGGLGIELIRGETKSARV